MALIHMRVMAKVPVIIMGETGCGKTSLIKFFTVNVRQGELEVFNIHAGVSSNDIEKKVAYYQEKSAILAENFQNLWVFFDEFNTTENVGIICEIICNRTYLGERLNENIIFLAACNPYKIKNERIAFHEDVGIKRNRFNNQRLLYTVFPIPNTAIEYVWDYGSLKRQDQKAYIERMLFRKGKEFTEVLSQLIELAHEYYKQNEDSSSVSLRDVSRFLILFNWFREQIQFKYTWEQNVRYGKEQYYRYEQFIKKQGKGQVPFTMYENSIDSLDLEAGLLAFCHCYYLRLSQQSQRERFLRETVDRLKINFISSKFVLGLMEREQTDYLARMEIPREIAINQALKENIFAVIPCVVNKIPIFICGKPGCSKSLTITLIFQHLKGDKSADDYFRHLPELQVVPFQGSESCTSESIIKVYERAKKYLNTTEDKRLLPVFVFDEIGLAELSPYNPLKVLHSMLELEKREIAFIGVSNWRLDASKMNRALYLARPDPDEQDLIVTARTLYQDCCVKRTDRYLPLIEALAKAYLQLKENFKNSDFANYYGLRDFYSLIKLVSRRLSNLITLQQTEEEDVMKAVKNSIERNFGGHKRINGAEKMGKFFMENYGCAEIYNFLPDTNTIELIYENLKDRNARYLLLISKEDVATYILDQFIKTPIKNRRVMIGSNFEQDRNQEEYGYRSLSDCILYIEKGINVIFKNMEHIYSSLYDLFNQNFSTIQEKNYCRIGFGAIFNKCQVHDNFHSIIFMDDNDEILKKTDPPFLNRFEKHYFSLESILTDELKKIVSLIENWANQLMEFSKSKKNIVNINAIFPIFSKEVISLLLIKHLKESKDPEELMTIIKRELLKTASSDVLVLTRNASISEAEKSLIYQLYEETHRDTFEQLVIKSLIDELKFNKLLIFTYSKDMLSESHSIQVKRINDFSTEQEFLKCLNQFFASPEQKLFLLSINLKKESQHLSYVKYMIDKIESETQASVPLKKYVAIVIRLKRCIPYNSDKIMIFDGWDSLMIEEIFDGGKKIDAKTLEKSSFELISEEIFVKFNGILGQITEKSLIKLKYDKLNETETYKINTQICFVLENITKDKDLVEQLKQKAFKIIEKQMKPSNWKEEIFCNSEITLNADTILKAVVMFVELELEKAMNKIVFYMESNGLFRSYFTDFYEDWGVKTRRIWLDQFTHRNLDDVQLLNIPERNQTQLFWVNNCYSKMAELKFPFSKFENEELKKIYLKQIQYEQQQLQNSEQESKASLEVLQTKNIKHFSSMLSQKSILDESFYLLLESPELQNNYIHDLVVLFLGENLLDQEFKLPLLKLYEIVFADCSDFKERVLEFMRNREQLANVCEVLKIMSTMRQMEVMPFLEQETEEVNYSMMPNSSFEQQIISIDFDEGEIFEDFWPKKIQKIVESAIFLSCSGYQLIKNEKDMKIFGSELERLFTILQIVQGYFPVEDIQILRFYLDLTQIFIEADIKNCSSLQTLLSPIKSQKHFKSIYEDPYYISGMLYTLEQIFQPYPSRKTSSLRSFKINLYNYSIEKLPNMISLQAKEIEEGIDYQNLSSIFMAILSLSELSETILWNEDADNQTEEMNFQFVSILKHNKYEEEIDNAIVNSSLNSKFTVLLSDAIKNMYPDLNSSLKTLSSQSKLLKFYLLNSILDKNVQYGHLRTLISLTRIKMILDIYIDILVSVKHSNLNLTEEEVKMFSEIDELICNNPLKRVLSLYCLKKLKFHFPVIRINSQFLKQIKNQYSDLNWPSVTIEDEQINDELELPLFEGLLQEEDKILVEQLQENDETALISLTQRVQNLNNPKQRLSFGVALINQVLIQFYQEQVPSTLISHYIAQSSQHIIAEAGPEYYKLLLDFSSNYDKKTKLHVSPNISVDELYKILAISYILLIIVSYKDCKNALSSIFFEEGKLSINQFNNSYLFGIESNFKYQYLKTMLDTFEMQKNTTWNSFRYFWNKSKGGTWKCSNDCDFIYIIQDCGTPINGESDCPWCGKKIFGRKHKGVDREGHENLSDQEAVQLLQNKVEQYEKNMDKGYFQVFTPCQDMLMSCRGLRPLSYRVLNFILHSGIYGLWSADIIGEKELEIIIPGLEEEKDLNMTRDTYCYQHLNADYQTLVEILSCENSHIWMLKVIQELANFLSNESDQILQPLPHSPQHRSQFENQFQELIIDPLSSNVQETIISNQYKRMNMQGKTSLDSLINELDSRDADSEFKYLKLFRITLKPSYQDMCRQFNLYLRNKNNHILQLSFELQADFRKLKHLPTILNFSNKLMQKYDKLLSRDEARQKKMVTVFKEMPELEKQFSKFTQALKDLGSGPFQLGCKQLSNRTYTKHSELIDLLVDNKEEGGGMYLAAVLTELAQLQNKNLTLLLNAYNQERKLEKSMIIDRTPHQLQKIKDEHILTLDFSDPKYAEFSLNNPEYGKGKQVIYDFQKIKERILVEIHGKKYLDVENLQFISYQFELDPSSVIADIRKSIPQKKFEAGVSSRIENQLISIQSDKQSTLQPQQKLRQMLASLDIILCVLQNESVSETMKINEFCKDLKNISLSKVSDEFKRGHSAVGELPLQNIVYLYELLEIQYFEFVLPYLKDQYCYEEQDYQYAQKLVDMFANDNLKRKAPSMQELESALKRFIIRCLSAEIEPSHPLASYIIREEYWDESVIEKLDLLSESFPSSIQIKHTKHLLDYLQELIKQQKTESHRKIKPDQKSEESKSPMNPIQAQRGKHFQNTRGGGHLGTSTRGGRL